MTNASTLLLEPDTLETWLNNPDTLGRPLLIVDLGQPQTYQQIHLPGAVYVRPAELVCGIPPASGKLPSLAQLEELFGRIGYDPEQHIVAYDDEGGGWAGRFLWTLDVIGHKHYSLLNGGLHAWYKEDHPLSTETPEITPTSPKLSIDTSAIAELETVLASLEDPHCKIWDARTREEYEGTKLSAARGGHIPGAVNLDWLDTMDKSRNLRLLPLEQIKATLAERGITDGDSIITHCQSHHRSGLTYMIAKLLGFEVKAYHGSWAEWGNNPDTPIEN